MSLDSLFKQDKKKTQQDFSEDEISGEFHSRAELESSSEDEKRGAKTAKRQSNARKNLNDSAALPEKKRARRRLIGALALVLAAVIGLPMIFDSEPKPAAQKITIDIPSKETPFSASTPAPVRPPLIDQTGLQQGIDPSEEIVKNTDSDAAHGSAAKNSPPSNTVKTVVADATAKSPVVAAPTESEKNAPKTSDMKSGAANGVAALSKPAAPLTATVANKATADTVKKNETPTPIVSATPPASGDSKQIKKEKLDDEARALALLEGREPPVAEKKSEVNTPTAGGFAVQVAALNSSAKVKELQNTLKAAHIPSYTQKVITKTGEVSRVRVGPFANKAEAEKMRAKLEKLGLNGSLIPR